MPVDMCSPTEGVWYWNIFSPLVIRDIEDAGISSAHTTLRHFLSAYWLAQFKSLVSWALNVFQNLKSIFRISKICQNINDLMLYLLPNKALNHFLPSLRYHLKTVFSFTQQKPEKKFAASGFSAWFFCSSRKLGLVDQGKRLFQSHENNFFV